MEEIKIDPEFEKLIPPLKPEEFVGLENSIKTEGCRDPIILWNNILIDGHNRYLICAKNSIPFETKELEFEDRTEAIVWIIDNQLSRRNLSNYDRVRLALKQEEYFKEKAKNQLKTHTDQGYQRSDKAVHVSKEIAQIANVSHDTVNKVKLIEEKAPDDIKEKLSEQKITINKAYKDIRREEKKEEFLNNPQELPDEEFNVIYADPPWRYEHSKTKNRDIENQYPTMELEDIKQLEVPANEDSVLFLWATAPKLKEALEVMESWGFNYRTNIIWDKETIGMGYWARIQHEILLIGVKGKFNPPFEENRFPSVYQEKKTRHSSKPHFYYEMIEKMFPNGKYLELFSRTKRDGWVMWGSEI